MIARRPVPTGSSGCDRPDSGGAALREARPGRRTLPACLATALALSLPAAAQEGDGFGELGANDFRISFQEGTGNPAFGASSPAVAHNPVADEYLVVWTGRSDCVSGGSDLEIRARRVDGATGALLGHALTLSRMGPPCDPDYTAVTPAVTYNATRNEYLIVWSGRDWAMAVDEYDIFGQRLQGEIQVGEDDFRISRMGGNGDGDYQGRGPDVAWNATADEYLVVWWGDHDVGGLIDGEFEIFGQRLDGSGTEIGADDFRISDMGGTGDPVSDAFHPAVAWNGARNGYLVVWEGDDLGVVANEEFEVFGQLLDGAGEEIGANDFRISDLGGTGDPAYDARIPAVACNASRDEYLVVWTGDDNVGGLIDDELEIFGQRLDGLGGEVGSNDFRISDLGGTGQLGFYAEEPAVAWSPSRGEFLVVWRGHDTAFLGEREVVGQRLDELGGEIGANDFRISDMGPDGSPLFAALSPSAAWNPASEEFLVVWRGDDDVGGLVEGEYEIFGQRLGSLAIFADGFESGSTSAWDVTVH